MARLQYCMTYDDVLNLVTVTKMNLKDEMPCGYGTLRTTALGIWHQVSHRAEQMSQLLSKSSPDLRRGFSCSRSLLLTGAEVSAAPKCDYRVSHILEHAECTSITAGDLRST